MYQTYSSSLSSSSLEPSSLVPSSRASSTHPFSQPRQDSVLSVHCETIYFQVRSIIADYAVVLTLIIFVTFDHTFNLATPKLTVPTELKVQQLSSESFLQVHFPANSVRLARLVDTHDGPLFPLVHQHHCLTSISPDLLLAWFDSHWICSSQDLFLARTPLPLKYFPYLHII